MDGEIIGWLIFIFVWFVSSIVQQIRKMNRNVPGGEMEVGPEGEPVVVRRNAEEGSPYRPPPPPRETARPTPPEHIPDPLRDLMRQLGVEVVEQPVPSEHRRTPSEHRQAPGEISQTAGETLITHTEHQRTASEARRTASEHRQDLGEVGVTPSEHRRGDVRVPARPARPKKAPSLARRRSVVGAAVRRDLRRGGRKELKKALVLKELLDRPMGLRPPGMEEGRG